MAQLNSYANSHPPTMSVERFSVPGHATRRRLSVYAVVATKIDSNDWYIYVGKTGDNRAGCNPVISRAGNHFSYNRIHSQVRNKLAPTLPHEFDFEYFYVSFHNYSAEDSTLRHKINSINELERAANIAIHYALPEGYRNRLLNPYLRKGYLSKEKQAQRASLQSDEHRLKIANLAAAVAAFVVGRA